MRQTRPPFRFDFDILIEAARRKLNNRVEGIELTLPFLTVVVCPDDLEQQVAREVVIRMSDKRVLNSSECCDHCIDEAISSLLAIRNILVDKQVELSKATDGPLYFVLEFMLEAIRQFLTFEQRLKMKKEPTIVVPASSDFRRPQEQREAYFAALEMLRAHLYRCLVQVSAIADVRIPQIAQRMRYDEAWQLDAYKAPQPMI
jgi:hypothetical protein